MKLKFTGLVLAIAMAAGGAALAETKADTFGLGNHEAAPEKMGKIGKDITIRVRLIREKTGELASVVTKGETVAVKVDFIGREGAKDRPIALVCYAQFIDTVAEKSAMSVNGKPCLEGRLEDSYGRFSPLDMSLRFHAEASDPAGTYGVVVKIEDSVSGQHVVLVPTYAWVDGKK